MWKRFPLVDYGPPVYVPSQYAPHPMREASDSIWRSGCVHQSNSSLDAGDSWCSSGCSSLELWPGLSVLLCKTWNSVELLLSPS